MMKQYFPFRELTYGTILVQPILREAAGSQVPDDPASIPTRKSDVYLARTNQSTDRYIAKGD